MAKFDADRDRHPSIGKVLRALAADENITSATVERIEITTLGNGETNCRYWPKGAEEPEVVFYAEGTL